MYLLVWNHRVPDDSPLKLCFCNHEFSRWVVPCCAQKMEGRESFGWSMWVLLAPRIDLKRALGTCKIKDEVLCIYCILLEYVISYIYTVRICYKLYKLYIYIYILYYIVLYTVTISSSLFFCSKGPHLAMSRCNRLWTASSVPGSALRGARLLGAASNGLSDRTWPGRKSPQRRSCWRRSRKRSPPANRRRFRG